LHESCRAEIHAPDRSRPTAFDQRAASHQETVHAPTVAAELKLKTIYPPSSAKPPCCRCGRLVDRSLPHISYTMTEMNMEYGEGDWVGNVVKDKEFAILCQECETPDELEAEAEDKTEEQHERCRA
jgi:hypothetical protein